MRQRRGPWRGLALLVVVAAIAGWAATHNRTAPTAARPAPPATSAPATTSESVPAPPGDQNPGRFAVQVVAHANTAGVAPQLLMAILYNEAYKPHDPGLERAWQRITTDAAFGIANMHKATFDETKRGRSFAKRDWQELPDDPDLAIEAAAWQLHDLAARLPAKSSTPYTRDELLALGYNAGASSMTAFARGAEPGPVAKSYVDRLRQNWAVAGEAIQHAR